MAMVHAVGRMESCSTSISIHMHRNINLTVRAMHVSTSDTVHTWVTGALRVYNINMDRHNQVSCKFNS